MSRYLFLTAERSGNHLVLRSLSKSLNIPYGIFINYDQAMETVKDKDKYIISIHCSRQDIKSDKLINEKIYSIYRNPLDHAISLLRFKKYNLDPNSKEFIKWVNAEYFLTQRKIIQESSASYLINYDILLDKDNNKNHIDSIKKEFNLNDFKLENISDTQLKIGFRNAPIGKSGRWREIITYSTWSKLIDIIDEPLNVYWDNPDKGLTNEDAYKNYIHDFKIG